MKYSVHHPHWPSQNRNITGHYYTKVKSYIKCPSHLIVAQLWGMKIIKTLHITEHLIWVLASFNVPESQFCKDLILLKYFSLKKMFKWNSSLNHTKIKHTYWKGKIKAPKKFTDMIVNVENPRVCPRKKTRLSLARSQATWSIYKNQLFYILLNTFYILTIIFYIFYIHWYVLYISYVLYIVYILCI